VSAVFEYRGLGMADWRDVVDAFAIPEPCRPFPTRGLTPTDKVARVERALGLTMVAASSSVTDFEGRSFRVRAPFVEKLARYANHAAYAGWIATTMQQPLEVWEHADPRADDHRPRRHYFAAYVGPSGATTHLVVAAVGDVLLNRFRIENVSTANEKRFGRLLYVGYAPVYPPLPKAKGAPFPVAPLPG